MAKAKQKKAPVPADWYIKFTGAMPVVNVPEPEKGDVVEFTVVGNVWKLEDARRGDGEDRVAWSVKLTDVWPAGAERPAETGLMFDRQGETTAEARGDDVEASADEGDELAAKRAETGEWEKGYPEGAGQAAEDVANATFSHGTVTPPAAD